MIRFSKESQRTRGRFGLLETNTQLRIPNSAFWWWWGSARLVLLVCLGTRYAAAQAAAEYGGAVATAGARAAATQPLKSASGTFPQDKPGSVHLLARPTEDLEAANRKALQAGAGKDAANLTLRSVPNEAWVRIGGKPVGRTPLLLIVAPGTYQVEMERPGMELGRRQVDLLPKETREVVLALETRYPSHVRLSWPSSLSVRQ